MSSKLIRGRTVPTEPADWRRVSSSEAIAGSEAVAGESLGVQAMGGASPAPGYLLEPRLTSGAAAELEQRAEFERRIGTAHRQGFEEGQAAAGKSLAGQVEAMQLKLARSIEELTGSRLRFRREAEQDVVALALAVARRILHRELTMAPEALLGLVKAALEKLEAGEAHRVRVSRADAPAIQQFFERTSGSQSVEVLADASLAPGAVLIESPRGLLDASVDTQLAEIERGFADLVQNAK